MNRKLVVDERVLNSSLLSESPSLKLLKIIGSPFASSKEVSITSEESLKLYSLAVKNKITMLYLEALKQQGRLDGLEAKYEEEKARYLAFIDAVARVSKVLEAAGIEFAIYKTIKPYPAVPGDIDVITLGDGSMHTKAAEMLLRAGYEVDLPGVIDTKTLTNDDAYKRASRLATTPTSYKHEHISPTSTDFIAPENNILIDLRKELAMNYTLWMDKNNFREHIARIRLSNGEEINNLTPELDLAVTIMHSLMENLYLLGEFYTFIFQLSKMDEKQIDELLSIVKKNRIITAAKVFIAITAALCQAAYGAIPEELYMMSDKLGSDTIELRNMIRNNFSIPHRYKVLTVARILLEKTKEGRFRQSVLRQMLSMLNPMQAKLVVSELIGRRSREIY